MIFKLFEESCKVLSSSKITYNWLFSNNIMWAQCNKTSVIYFFASVKYFVSHHEFYIIIFAVNVCLIFELYMQIYQMPFKIYIYIYMRNRWQTSIMRKTFWFFNAIGPKCINCNQHSLARNEQTFNLHIITGVNSRRVALFIIFMSRYCGTLSNRFFDKPAFFKSTPSMHLYCLLYLQGLLL